MALMSTDTNKDNSNEAQVQKNQAKQLKSGQDEVQLQLQEVWNELRQKESDLILAAEFGKDLLDTNQKLKADHELLVRDFNDSIEELEQERYLLQRKLANLQTEYETRVYELQTEINDLTLKLDNKQQEVKHVEKSKNKVINELTVQNSRLASQLKQSLGSESSLRNELTHVRDECAASQFNFDTHLASLVALNDEIELSHERNVQLEEHLRDTRYDRNSLTDIIEQLVRKIQILKRKFDEQSEQMQLLRKQTNDSNTITLNQRTLIDSLRTLRGLEQNLRHLQQDSLNQDSGLVSDCLSLISMDGNCEISDDKLLKLFMETVNEIIRLVSDNDIIRLVNVIDGLRQQMRNYEADLAKQTDQLLKNHNELAMSQVQLITVQQERDQAVRDIETIRSCVSQDDTVSLAFRARDIALEQKRKLDLELAQLRFDLMQSNQQLMVTIQQKVHLSQQIEQWQIDIKELLDDQLRVKLLNNQQTKTVPVSRLSRNILFKLFQ